jgi:hypothetical protein
VPLVTHNTDLSFVEMTFPAATAPPLSEMSHDELLARTRRVRPAPVGRKLMSPWFLPQILEQKEPAWDADFIIYTVCG